MEKTINEVLTEIQNELKVPKNQRNNFGNYNYRSCEDILESVKPIVKKHEATLILSDEIVEVGSRVYVKAKAIIFYKSENILCFGYAREEETKKGMDGSQITGSASSYARKYALNGLFLIDDTKDSDHTNEHGKQAPTPKAPTPKAPTPIAKKSLTPERFDTAIKLVEDGELSKEDLVKKLDEFQLTTTQKITLTNFLEDGKA